MKKIVQCLTIAVLGTLFLNSCKKSEPIPTALASVGSNTISETVDYGTLTKTLYVSGLSGNVNEVQVRFKGSSPFTADVELYLKSPSGKILQLCNNLDRQQAPDVNTTYPMIDVTFSDAATVAIKDWTLVSTAALVGTYRPQGGITAGYFTTGTITNLAGFKGETPNGTWTLYVSDDANRDILTFTSWELLLSTVN